MNNDKWISHLSQWRTFLEERLSVVIETGERKKIERQLIALEKVRFSSVLNPNLLIDFITPNTSHKSSVSNDIVFCLDPLNGSQKEAVTSVLSSTNFLSLIQGPPGTGKTQVIAEICLQLYRKNPNIRILVCSETHTAVNNLLTRIAENNESIRIIRIQDKEKKPETDSFTVESITAEYLKWLQENCDNQEITEAISDTLSDPENKSLEKALALSANVVGMTCNRVGAYRFNDSTEMFDYAIIDEVCKATLPEILMPLTISMKAILVGDPKQLPPVFCSEDLEIIKSIENCDLQRYMYIDELMIRSKQKTILNTQYRMENSIGNLIRELFYKEEDLKNGRNENVEDSLVWIDYRPTHEWPAENEKDDSGRPIIHNTDECAIIKTIYNQLHSKVIDSDQKIAIITPYRHQIKDLKDMLPDATIETVDGVQGKEYDIVIFGITRTTGSYRFLADERRLNVALSRAKNQIIIVGNHDYSIQHTLLKKIYEACKHIRSDNSKAMEDLWQ